MLVSVDGQGREARLGAAAADLYADLRLSPLLRRLLVHSRGLLHGVAGSVSLIDPVAHRYAKMAEQGASCRLGQSFPLEEGITGQVAARRTPVVLRRYSDLASSHLPASHPASDGAVAAVPIWWRGEVIGANVVFAGSSRDFRTDEVDELESITQVAAAGIVRAGASDPSLAHLIREDLRRVDGLVTEVGHVRPVPRDVAAAAVALVAAAERACTGRLHVALVHRPDGLRLLVQDDARGAGVQDWTELAEAVAGVTVERVEGWGTVARADLPYAPPAPDPSPLTARESEVAALLARGLSDREIARALVISPKTVEKHVGAVLRKTGTASRTAAVVRALDRGWLPAAG